MNRFTLAFCLAVASCAAAPAHAEPTFPDRGRAGVVDAAGVIPAAEESALNERVVAWDKATGHQLVVATVPSLGGATIADYGVALGRKWGLGHDGLSADSDGVILLLAPNERKVRIEVGYGLEPILTDALTSEIIRDQVLPGLKADDIPGALSAGADAIMRAATPPPAPKAEPKAMPSPARAPVWPSILAAFVVAIGCAGFLLRRALRQAQAERAAALDLVEQGHADLRKRYRQMRPGTVMEVPEGRRAPPAYPERPFSPTPPRLTRTVGPESGPTYTGRRASPPPPPPPPPPSPGYDFGSSSTGSSDWGSSSSSDSGSSSSFDSGFDSGGGSFGGGGSDSSY